MLQVCFVLAMNAASVRAYLYVYNQNSRGRTEIASWSKLINTNGCSNSGLSCPLKANEIYTYTQTVNYPPYKINVSKYFNFL